MYMCVCCHNGDYGATVVIMEHRKFVTAQDWLPYTIIVALLCAATVVCEYQSAELEGHVFLWSLAHQFEK